ncbi:sodium/hydrogen exchanger 4 isoform X2 [Ziziphus jujuba]|uniref:Sodium/hydrogen exchanger 4 isoform X2 n=1 Tax=Ziziphus jujuba TaxID=326968 RepID=A0ABM3IWJ2_ZIZJJ|nr:sodium/hydrogen exchanger 4 isoform X2 [Ziziphus jujuba]
MAVVVSELTENVAGEHAQLVIPITLFVAVLCLCIVIGHLLQENQWVNESITAIFIGSITGTVILILSKWKSSHILTFNEELFFIYLLPPIIFNAGWWLFPRLKFHGLTARDYLVLGTIFSATDTVCTLQVLHQDETPLLYSLVFGEGVVNDATTVVLFNAIQKIDVTKLNSKAGLRLIVDFLYLFSTSTALGVTAGLLTAYALKTLYFGRQVTFMCFTRSKIVLWEISGYSQTVSVKFGIHWNLIFQFAYRHASIREIALMVLMAYLSYMLAELFELSGILTVFFCGIVMSHYAWHNVTDSSRITTRYLFAMMSFVAETFIFLYVGMDALDIEKWRISKLSFGTSVAIYATIILLMSLGRAAFVFPLSALSNYMNRRADRTYKITFRHQVIIWWAGLMRGAVSIALAFKQYTFSGVTMDPTDAVMITNTIIVVLFSTVVFGFLTKPLISYLLPNSAPNNLSREESKILKEDMNLPLLSFEESATTNILRAKDSLSMLIERPVYTIHYYWRRFDDAYMRPIFGGPISSSSSR